MPREQVEEVLITKIILIFISETLKALCHCRVISVATSNSITVVIHGHYRHVLICMNKKKTENFMGISALFALN